MDATQPADLLLRAEAALKRIQDEAGAEGFPKAQVKESLLQADNAEVTQDSRRELVEC